MDAKELILNYTPIALQNVAISIFNTRQYRTRHGGEYAKKRLYYKKYSMASREAIERESQRKLHNFLVHAQKNSTWYSCIAAEDLSEFPILEKSDILENLDVISTIKESEGVARLTGGTTGASMKVIYTHGDVQDRHAVLDYFRSTYGYELGKKVAWFTGKKFVREKDLLNGNVCRDDLINKIRFFSTFHINKKRFDSYWSELQKFEPEFVVGFPSSIYDLCHMALERGVSLQGIKVFFPTAETVLPHHRAVIERVLGCQIIDQYASSEGAPFILQCPHGSLHMHTLTGIFEVVDENMQPASEGELLVTAFATYGTPLIRYRIGDRVKLASSDYACPCGSSFPVAEAIYGRSSDFILSPENGRVRNLSVCTKGVLGIISFQVVQYDTSSIEINMIAGAEFSQAQKKRFLNNISQRVGSSLVINLKMVENIPREKSGKYRIVKNMIPQEVVDKCGYL